MENRKQYLPTTSAERKQFPMFSGLMAYFPDALAAVSEVSFKGNEKHNPGEPLHHARGKSMDHADCCARHLLNHGGFDGDVRESASLAWRALALLQEELEHDLGLPLPRGARAELVADLVAYASKPPEPSADEIMRRVAEPEVPLKFTGTGIAAHDKTDDWDERHPHRMAPPPRKPLPTVQPLDPDDILS